MADKAGVVGVTAVEPEGDDGLPFQQLAHEVTVTMDAGATADQV